MAKQDPITNTTLSARFDEGELALLRQAAELKQWSLSQLIRVGAFEKAVNIVNANRPAAHLVRRLLGEVLTQLFDAKVMTSSMGRPESIDVFDPGTFGIPAETDVYATKADRETVVRLVKAIRSLGAELAPMFMEELKRVSLEPETEFDLIDPTVVMSEMPVEPSEAALRSGGGRNRRIPKAAQNSPKRKKRRKGN